jgi:hypothetical protein
MGRWKVVGIEGRGGMPDGGGWRRFVARRAWYGSKNDASGLFEPNSSEGLKVELHGQGRKEFTSDDMEDRFSTKTPSLMA